MLKSIRIFVIVFFGTPCTITKWELVPTVRSERHFRRYPFTITFNACSYLLFYITLEKRSEVMSHRKPEVILSAMYSFDHLPFRMDTFPWLNVKWITKEMALRIHG